MKLRNQLLTMVALGSLATFAIAGQKDGFRRYHDEADAAQAALEGKAPPPIVSSEWLNSKPLNWKALKGKVVLLDMWAYW